MSKQIQVKKISEKKNHSSIYFCYFSLLKNIILKTSSYYILNLSGGRSHMFSYCFIKFPNHKGILVRKHQGINTSSKQRKIHIHIPKEMTACASILVKQKEKEMHMFKIVNINLYPKSQ